MAFYQALPWHEGEDKIHKLTRVPPADNPTHPMLSSFLAKRVSTSPTIALGTIDDQGRVWCTVWGGDVPIAQQVAPGGIIGVRSQVDASFDPVVQALYSGKDDGEVVRHDPNTGKMVSGLSIKLEDRDRVKLFGRMMAGSLSADERAPEATEQAHVESEGQIGRTGNAQLVLQITQSLGNCPKYLNKKTIKSYPDAKPRLASESALLNEEAVAHVHNADLFFVASRGPEDMDCNYRGGPPGFVRVQRNQDPSQPQSSVLVWPEYSGNNLYQTLGNIMHDPKVGIVIPNLENGNVLYLTGHAEILIDKAASTIIQKSKLAVRLTITAARFVQDGLPFRGEPCADNKDVSSSHPTTTHSITDGQSPYNPRIRYLTSELPSTPDKTNPNPESNSNSTSTPPPDEHRHFHSPTLTATLTKKTKLTPTITKYRFSLHSSNHASFDPSMSPLWQPGQYIALDFSDELYMGYTHMNDNEPTSLNDDFIRTFTIASIYTPPTANAAPEFEIVARNVGVVTKWLSCQNDRSGMTRIGVSGFGGTFRFEKVAVASTEEEQQGSRKKKNAFIAAGIGITPLLGQVSATPSSASENGASEPGDDDVLVLWTLNIADIGLALDVVNSAPGAMKRDMRLFVTGTETQAKGNENMKVLRGLEEQASGLRIARRRLMKEDLTALEKSGEIEVQNWHLCTAPTLRKQVQEWLDGKTVVFENFDY
ncbi:hypothetical protein LTR70_001502 [Exophiala xenobiotica]|uniref:FAD-binding FR-type domain-containing protein n=1 Tax=Lithohypha guttulata TaxID=1690604 RepID=A0ABR0KH83_9EURO|nr:hypothetical protein LTR24_002792 [Lithohypha guttulata]KAK5327879.1 hypothetical protein LTR70_001502 [Exophiala xenobiotica]